MMMMMLTTIMTTYIYIYDNDNDNDDDGWYQHDMRVTVGHAMSITGPMLESDGSHFNRRWGFLSRSGLNDKSQLMRQVEKYADIYTSRVSNFLRYSPFMYFRSPSQSLAHDRSVVFFLQLFFFW